MKKSILIGVLLLVLASMGQAEISKGDFVIEKNQELAIKDKTLEIDGNFIIDEGATLLIENSTIIIRERYKSEHRIVATNANVRIINSEIDSSENRMVEELGKLVGPELNILMADKTSLNAENSSIYGRVQIEQSSKGEIANSTVSFVYWNYDSDLKITDSLLGSFVFDCKVNGLQEPLVFDGLKRDKETNFTLHAADGGSLALQDTVVRAMWSVNFEYGCKKDITIRDSEIENVWIKFPPTDERITIRGLPHGFIREYDLRAAVSGIVLPYNVRLENTELNEFKPEMWSANATILDSYAMVHPYDASDLIIKNSTLDSLFNYGCKRIEFYDVTIRGISLQLLSKPEFKSPMRIGNKTVGEGGRLHFVFHNSTIDSSLIVVANEGGEIEGNVTFVSPKNPSDVDWIKGVITRTYPVIAWPNANLTLWNGNSTVWAGETDDGGMASFSLTFDNKTYADEFTLEAPGSKTAVDFLTDTPIDLIGSRESATRPPEGPTNPKPEKPANQQPEELAGQTPEASGINPNDTLIVFVLAIAAVAASLVLFRKFRKTN